ncbi:hypothetical protein GG804_19665 [Sphingomonas histidinilytica]|uniref:hypothetical protein n=1 Tax=Rhizorhabdus histidinilytica TaxID=439228 RepID=UPI001ADCAD93|nr:hypothetical protein [Rhizorhabdus histidinilytica]MBO9378990.1 hypothetical protein [Rhizorhabdus histidinilytica]
MSFAILIIALLCLFLTNRKFGTFSFPFAGACSFLIYSVPAILGLSAEFYYSGQTKYFVSAQAGATGIVLLAWCGFALVVIAYKQLAYRQCEPLLSNNNYSDQMKIATVLSFLGLGYLIVTGGLFFFTNARDEQLNDFATLLWRWFVLIGFAAAIVENNRRYQVAMLFLIAIIFLRGDRTIPAIAGALYVVLYFRFFGEAGGFFKKISRPKFIISVILLSTTIFIGKPIYLSVKEGDISILRYALADDPLSNIVMAAEPFGTFNHISSVMNLNIDINFFDFISSILANLTIVPSFFGLNTNLYNETITSAIPYSLSYGIAGNYWAHAWAVGGYLGVILFSLIYPISLIFCDRYLVDKNGRVRLSLAVIGALTAIYVHRNGLDNFLSFVRQICVAAFIVYVIHIISRARNSNYGYLRL